MALTLDPRFVIEIQPTRHTSPDEAMYRRRRLVALLLLGTLAVTFFLGGRALLADSGGTASASTVSPASATADGPVSYVVHPGESMWSIARQFAGSQSLVSYVDDLIALNGGASIQAGQQILLP